LIDVDVLLYDEFIIESGPLILPHPRMFERAFVMIPLAELAPDLTFPDGTTLAERLADPNVRAQKATKVLSAECWVGAHGAQHSALSTQD
jgi:7,8-dihydro-6-hydroxymethylpterin-pyrophosphokinase